MGFGDGRMGRSALHEPTGSDFTLGDAEAMRDQFLRDEYSKMPPELTPQQKADLALERLHSQEFDERTAGLYNKGSSAGLWHTWNAFIKWLFS